MDGDRIVGTSQVAGQYAVGQTIVARILTSAPVLLFSPLIMHYLGRTSMLQRYPKLYLPAQLGAIAGLLMTGLPCALAIFPPKGKISVENLESRFQGILGADGIPIKMVSYNKGL